jgi:hypothetical protein
LTHSVVKTAFDNPAFWQQCQDFLGFWHLADYQFTWLTFHIGKLLGNLAIAHAEYVHPPDVTLLAFLISPVVNPADDAAIPSGKQLFGLELSPWRGLEESLESGSHCLTTYVPHAIRRGMGILKDAILRRSRHYRLDVLPVKSFVEAMNSGNCSG